ncbi:hypothetical protein ACVGXN_02175, partial [Enterobacter hormaechei]
FNRAEVREVHNTTHIHNLPCPQKLKNVHHADLHIIKNPDIDKGMELLEEGRLVGLLPSVL